MKHRLLANSINSNDGDISAEKNIVRNTIEPLEDIAEEAYVTRRQLEAATSGITEPTVIELTSGQTIPYSFSLPGNFNGKYQVDIKIDRGGGFWESYPSAKIVDLLDTSGGITNYFVNRVDIYGNDAGDGTNLDHLLFTFSKA